LLAGDRIRALQELETEADRLRAEARSLLDHELDEALANGDSAQAARERFTGKIVAYFDAALQKVARETGERLSARFGAHQRRANEIITFVKQTATNLLEIPFRALRSEEIFETRRDPFWVTTANTVEMSPIPPDALDRFLPGTMRKKRVRLRLQKEIDKVVCRNVENLRWATLQNLEDAFRRFGSELDERLTGSLTTTRGAMKAALNLRIAHSEAVQSKLAEAQASCARLVAIERELELRKIMTTADF